MGAHFRFSPMTVDWLVLLTSLRITSMCSIEPAGLLHAPHHFHAAVTEPAGLPHTPHHFHATVND